MTNKRICNERDHLNAPMHAIDRRSSNVVMPLRRKSFVHKTDDEIMEELRALRPKLDAGLRYLRKR